MAQRQFVCQHLENVSRRALAKYPEIKVVATLSYGEALEPFRP